MKTKIKDTLKLISAVLIVTALTIILNLSNIRTCLLSLGLAHLSSSEAISLFEKNKDDLKIAADYAFSLCKYYDKNTDTMGSDKEYKEGELIEDINLYYCFGGYYGATIINKIIESKGSGAFMKTVEPYYITTEAVLIFDKLRKNHFLAANVNETQNNSVYAEFILRGGGIFDRHSIVYFKDKEHDLEFFFGYKVVPLSEEGWYYLSLGDAKEW